MGKNCDVALSKFYFYFGYTFPTRCYGYNWEAHARLLHSEVVVFGPLQLRVFVLVPDLSMTQSLELRILTFRFRHRFLRS